MAPATETDCGSNPQQSILSLDKSNESFPTLIARACNILKIDLDQHWKQVSNVGGQVQRPVASSDPRPEWALRWLLKKLESAEKLKSAEIHNDNPRFNWRAWILLQALIMRISISSSARLLKAHGMIGILRETLQGLYNHLPTTTRSENKEASELSDSSADTVDNPQSKVTSKKRKRDGMEITEPQSLPTAQDIDVHRTFVAISVLLAQLQSLTIDTENTQDYALEHMKSSLRSKPEDAAKILGSSLYLANDLLHGTYRGHLRQESNANQLETIACSLCVDSAIGFWSARSDVTQDSYDSPTNVSHSTPDQNPGW
jgi:hypothetical protein